MKGEEILFKVIDCYDEKYKNSISRNHTQDFILKWAIPRLFFFKDVISLQLTVPV